MDHQNITGVYDENLGIAYSSTGNTVTSNVGGYDITGTVSDGTGLASNYTVTLTPGTLTVNAKAISNTIANDSQTNSSPDGAGVEGRVIRPSRARAYALALPKIRICAT